VIVVYRTLELPEDSTEYAACQPIFTSPQLSDNLTIDYGERILKRMLNQITIDQVFHAFGDPTRRKLVEQLSQGPASVSDLAKPLGITLAAVVQHLQVLERSGIVRTEKVGRVRTCRIEPTGLNVAADWIAERRSLWERRLDRLGDLLAEEAPSTEPAANRGISDVHTSKP
jgi:DNA-binding transcriptional ArsR family regulator